MTTSRGILLVFLLLLFKAGLSQTYSFKTFSASDGLSQDFVYSMAQSSRGSLWIGTGEGVFRYDGKKFKPFGKIDGLAENFITSSACDHRENIWFGHYNGGISVFDGNTFSIVDTRNFIDSPINCLLADSSFILAGTQNNGIIRINKDFTIDTSLLSKEIGSINAIVKLDEKTFLAATSVNVYSFFFPEGNSPVIKPLLNENTAALSISKISDGTILIGTRDNGILQLKTSGKTVKVYFPDLPDSQINIIFPDPAGTIWISSFGNGIFRYAPNKTKGYELTGVFSSKSGLPSDYIKSFLIDREGIVWFGTYGEGLSRLLSPMFTLITKNDGAPGETVKSIFKDDKRIYFLSDSAISYSENNTPERMSFKIDASVTCGIHFENNQYLIGTRNKGVYLFNSEAKTIKHWHKSANHLSNHINSLHKDKSGNIWVATEDGAFFYDREKSLFSRFGMEQGLAHNNISSIYTDKNETVWFGTHGGGLSGLKDGKVFYLPSPGKTGLDIFCFAEDDKGLWIGTYGQGIYRLIDGKFTHHIDKTNGISSNYCYSILIDRKGRIWIAHKNNLSIFNPKTEKFLIENENLVIADPGFQHLAAEQDNEGNLYFGTNSGILRYNFSAPPPLILPPIINIAGLLLEFKEVDWKNYSDSIFTLARIPYALELPYNKNHLTFKLSAVSLSSGPDQIKYQYKLEGYESSWSLITNEAFITYPNLPPGTYSFKVRAKAGDSKWGEINKPFQFTILAPFWQTWWFLSISSISFIGLVLYIIKARTEKLQSQREKLMRDKQRLEEEVMERIKAQKQQKIVEEKLIQTNQELNNFIYRSSHDLRGPISTVKGLTQLGIMEMKDPQAQKFFNLILDRTHVLDSVLKNLIDIVEVIEGETNFSIIDFKELEELLLKDLNQEKALKQVKVTIENKLQSNTFYNDKKLVFTILRNILDNSVKYKNSNSDAPFAKTVITDYKSGILFTFTDNGIGISKDVQPKIFDMFYRGSDESKGSGLGLYMVRKIVEKLHGKITLESKVQKGTTVQVYLPNLEEYAKKTNLD